MSVSNLCIACSEESDVVSVHDDMSFDGCLWTYSNIAALLNQYFGVKLEDIDASHAMCSACLGKLIQYCALRDQLVAKLNCIVDDQDNIHPEDNMETEYLEDFYQSDEYDSEPDIKDSSELRVKTE